MKNLEKIRARMKPVDTSKPHFAATISGQRWVPGDERSRTNPGHGYPEGYESYTDIIRFHAEEHLQEWLENHQNDKNYQIFHLAPVTIEKSPQLLFAQAFWHFQDAC